MDLIYKTAGIGDLELLTETRVRILRAVNHLPDTAPMDEVREHTRRYYQESLRDGSHTAYLVFDGERFAAAGGVSF